MKLRPDQQRVKTLISDTITLLCKNGLNYNSEFCVEALIGITLDKDQVFIVNINETITKSTKFIQSQGDLLSKIRKRRASNEKSQTGEIQNGTITGENDVSARKSPRMDEVARSPVSLGTSGPDSMVNDTEIVSSTKSKHPLDVIEVSAEAEVFDLSYKPNRETSSPAVHVIRPDPNEESSHDHLVLNSGEGEKDDGNENVPPAPVEAYNNLLTGPPVWPGQEPPLSFTSGLHNSGSTALPSNQDGTNQSQDWSMSQAVNGSPHAHVQSEPASPSSSQQQPIQLANGKSACPTCGKEFRENWMVRRHMLTHGAAAIVCPICSKRFKRKDTLKAHVDKTHQGQGYEAFKVAIPSRSDVKTSPNKFEASRGKQNRKNNAVSNPKLQERPGVKSDEMVDSSDFETSCMPAILDVGGYKAMTIEEFEGTNGRPSDETGMDFSALSENLPGFESNICDESNSPSKFNAEEEAYSKDSDDFGDSKDGDNFVDGIEFVNEDPSQM